MLQRLSISNYALIATLSIDFDNGFTVITGETGAGKSILLGALGFVLGNRADSNILFDETKKCVVEATFLLKDDKTRGPHDKERLCSFFEENDIDFEEEKKMLLRTDMKIGLEATPYFVRIFDEENNKK